MKPVTLYWREFPGGIYNAVELRYFPVNLIEPPLHRESWLVDNDWKITKRNYAHAIGKCREALFGYIERMKKPRLLDLFCGAGGSAKGYKDAGFHVTGVDIKPQPRYVGDVFIQGDALEYLREHGHEYDVIHASPPCQFAAQMFNPRKPEKRQEHQNLIPKTRALLQQLGKPYVIENVKGARKHLVNPLMLHGSMFGLPVFRDRYFEMSHPIYFTPVPRRDYTPVPINSSSKVGNKSKPTKIMAQAMNIDWMIRSELRQAIPPAYTEFIGKQMISHLSNISKSSKLE